MEPQKQAKSLGRASERVREVGYNGGSEDRGQCFEEGTGRHYP